MGVLMSVIVCVVSVVAGQPEAGAEKMMKAVRYQRFGGPEVLKYEEAPRPEAKADEVLIRVHAAAVNPVDWKIRKGQIPGRAGAFPVVPGFDVSGVVEAVGADVTAWKVGDEVYGMVALTRGGTYAEYTVAKAEEVAAKPKTIDHVHAAAVPLAALTAWQALFDVAKLEAGQTVLVHAGAGGVGHLAIQLAKARGARVIATASGKNLEFLKELGADEAIDYTATKFEEVVKEADVVLDSIGGTTLARSYGVLKKGGIVVSIVAAPEEDKCKKYGVRGERMLVKPDSKGLAEIAALIDAGKVKPHVSETLELKDARRAHELSESNRTRGKIVLKVR